MLDQTRLVCGVYTLRCITSHLPKLGPESLAVVSYVKLHCSVLGAQVVQQLLGINAEWTLGPTEDDNLQVPHNAHIRDAAMNLVESCTTDRVNLRHGQA